MKTQINGVDAEWPDEIQSLWARTGVDRPDGLVVSANYFEPRAYQHEYSQGSSDEGFVYTIGRDVWIVTIGENESGADSSRQR